MALTAVTTAMVTSTHGQPNGKLLRAALKRWAFNTARRDDPNCPDDIRSALRWVASHTRPVSALRDPGCSGRSSTASRSSSTAPQPRQA